MPRKLPLVALAFKIGAAAFAAPVALAAIGGDWREGDSLSPRVVSALDLGRHPYDYVRHGDLAIVIGTAGDDSEAAGPTWDGLLQVVHVGDGTRMRVLGSAKLQGIPTGIAIVGNIAYVSTRNTDDFSRMMDGGRDDQQDDAGLEVVDLTDPNNPRYVRCIVVKDDGAGGDSSFVAGANRITSTGRLVFVNTEKKIEVFDVGTPSRPGKIGEIGWGSGEEIRSILVLGNRLYVATSEKDLRVLNAPNLREVAAFGNGTLFGEDGPMVWYLLAIGGFLYWSGPNDSGVLDISNPDLPRPVGEPGGMLTKQVVDAVDRSRGILISSRPGQYPETEIWRLGEGTESGRVARKLGTVIALRDAEFLGDGDLLLGIRDESLVAVDISGRSPLRQIGSLKIEDAQEIDSVVAVGKHVVAGFHDEWGSGDNGRCGIAVVDFSDPIRPKEVLNLRGSLGSGEEEDYGVFRGRIRRISKLGEGGEFGFTKGEEGAFSIALHFEKLDTFRYGNWGSDTIHDAADFREVRVVTQGESGVMVVSSDGEKDRKIETPAPAFDIEIVGEHAFVSSGDKGLVVLSISDLESAGIVGFCAVPGTLEEMQASGSHLFCASGKAGLVVIDVSKATQPRVVGKLVLPDYRAQLSVPGPVSRLAVADGYAYVTAGGGGLHVVDVADPAKPVLVGTFYGGYVGDVAVSDNFVVATGLNGRAFIFEAMPPRGAKSGAVPR